MNGSNDFPEILVRDKIGICEMKAEYLSAVMRIEAESFTTPGSSALWERELADPGSRNFVALLRQGKSEEIAGFVNYWIVAGEAQLNTIAVKKDRRGMGIGGCLLETLLVRAGAEGAETATLEVRASNMAAINLYEKYAFMVKGRRRRYYDDGDDALIMWADITFNKVNRCILDQ